jgi:hypothetical protein
MSKFKLRFLLCTIILFLGVTGIAEADWFPGDGYKMHFPQLPDPFGWDVAFEATDGSELELADDWECSETGPVSDIHFWISWQGGLVGTIDRIQVEIYSDNPSGPGGYSEPDALLWSRFFYPGDWTELLYGSGGQGWFDPFTGFWVHPDHDEFYQINIADFTDPFIQEVGKIYWLKIIIGSMSGTPGWKTTLDNWNDDAVYRDFFDFTWYELIDPQTGVSLDLAFVITTKEPEVVKWVQWPDLNDTGMDVDATVEGLWPPQTLADDFNCVAPGPITDIHNPRPSCRWRRRR